MVSRSQVLLFATLAGAAGLASSLTTVGSGCGATPSGTVCYSPQPYGISHYQWCMEADLACGHVSTSGEPKCVATEAPGEPLDQYPPRACVTLCNVEHNLMLAAEQGALVPGSQAEAKYELIKQQLFDVAVAWCEEIADEENIVFAPLEVDCTEATQDEEPFRTASWKTCYSNPGNASCPYDDIPGSACNPPDPSGDGGTEYLCDPEPANSTGVDEGPPLYGISSWSQVRSCSGSNCNIDIDFAAMLNEHPELVHYDDIGATFLPAPNGQIGLKLTTVGTTSLPYALGLRKNDFIMSAIGVTLNSPSKVEKLRTALGVLYSHDDLGLVPVQVYRGSVLSTRNYVLVDMGSYP